MRAETFKSIIVTPLETYLNKRPAALAVPGSARKGIAARSWSEDAVYANDKNSPRFEIPAVIVRTMRLVNAEHLASKDMAVYWFLFASARKQGIHRERHFVTYNAVAKYLGTRNLQRVRDALDRLNVTDVRYDCNQDGTRCQAAKLIDIAEFDPNSPFTGRTEIYFSLPAVLRRAVQRSKDYAMVDINALSRLRSRYAITLYIRLCYLSRMYDLSRHLWEVDTDKLADILSFPKKGYRKGHLIVAVRQAVESIKGLGTMHRRFDFECLDPNEYTNQYQLTVGSSAKRVAEAAPAELSDAEYEVVVSRNVLPLEAHQYPSVLRFRQAASLVGHSTRIVSHEWRVDVWGATHYGADVAGMKAEDFLRELRYGNLEQIFDWWTDKLVFLPNGLRDRRLVQTFLTADPPFIRAPIVCSIREEQFIDTEVDLEDDNRVGEKLGVYQYGEPDGPPLLVAEDIDDCHIPY